MSDPLLTKLCSICHIHPPKYNCPRCQARTCSLQCVRTHKTRASCSGVRDPTQYIPRSLLATPAGIDHDYNFISGIERRVVAQEERAQERDEKRRRRGGGEEIVSTGAHRFAPLRNENFWKRLKETGARIEWAPKGMGRARENRTRCTRQRNQTNKSVPSYIIWTVEWIHANGSRSIDEDVREFTPVAEAYGVQTRQLQTEARKKRRKEINAGKFSQATVEAPDNLKRVKRQDHAHTKKDGNSARKADADTSKSSKTEPEQDTTNSIADSTPSKGGPPILDADQGTLNPDQESHQRPSTTLESKSEANIEPPPPTDTTHHFYLHRPYSSSPRPVLIPLSRTTTLFTGLQGQIIAEYPTIYALEECPEDLPSDYILEATYLAELECEQKEVDGMLGSVPVERKEEVQDETERWDEARLIESLRKDAIRS